MATLFRLAAWDRVAFAWGVEPPIRVARFQAFSKKAMREMKTLLALALGLLVLLAVAVEAGRDLQRDRFVPMATLDLLGTQTLTLDLSQQPTTFPHHLVRGIFEVIYKDTVKAPDTLTVVIYTPTDTLTQAYTPILE